MKIEAFAELLSIFCFPLRKLLEVSRLIAPSKIRPVAGGEAGRDSSPLEIFRFELNSATKVEF